MRNANILPKKERVVAYIDGFNLYFGMVEAGFDHCKWLNLLEMAKALLKDTQELVPVKYFTSRISNSPDKQRRQTIYLETLNTTGIQLYYGKFESTPNTCKRCGKVWPGSEKMTDVNIAVSLIVDAYKDLYDMAMLVSGDSDLVPSINAIHEHFPEKRVFVAFPPKRHNYSVEQAAKGSCVIGRRTLESSQFAAEVEKPGGYKLRKPNEW